MLKKEYPITQMSESVYNQMINEIYSKGCYATDMEYDGIDLIRIEEHLEPILKKYLLNKDIEDE